MLKLGCCLGPSIDISIAKTAKIFTENGQVLHRSSYKPFTPDELLDNNGSDAQEKIIARVYEELRCHVLPRELDDIWLENTTQYNLYKDEAQNEQTIPQLFDLEPMTEVGDHYT